jgi:antitoxin ParD1/3/4
MPTRNVVLTERQAALVDALVESGRYQDASEVLREGLRLVETREAAEKAKLEALRAAAQVGFSAVDRGEFTEFADASAMISRLDRIADEVVAGSTKA